jgi:hypothetical protein
MFKATKVRTEGIDHINAYSKSTLLLGRQLSNFERSPVNLPEDGYFESLEAYWYWLHTHDESLRSLHGIEAKTEGQKSRKRHSIPCPNFEDKFKKAMECKLKQNLAILHALKESSLPITHYYVTYEKGRKVVEMNYSNQWIWHHYECLRAKLKGEPEPEFIELKKPTSSLSDGTMDLFDL